METHNHSNSPAILAFLNSLELSSSIESMEDLVDGCVLAEVLLLIRDVSLGQLKLQAAPSWFQALSNMKTLLKHVEYLYESILGKTMEMSHLDLMSVCKDKNVQEISRVFFIVLGMLVQSSAKQYFIGRILSLTSEFQLFFAQVIKSSMQALQRHQKQGKEYMLLETVSELEHENSELHREIRSLTEELNKYRLIAQDLQTKLNFTSWQLDKVKSFNDQEEKEGDKDKGKDSKFLNKDEHKMVETLTQKLKALTTDHEKEILKYKEQMVVFSNRISRFHQLQTLVQTYKESHEQTMEQLKVMGDWEKDKVKTAQQLSRQAQLITEYEQSINQLNEKVSSLQEELIELQLSYQKLNARNAELQDMSNRKSSRTSLITSKPSFRTLSDLIGEPPSENSNEDLQKDIERKSKKICQLQKEVERLKFKGDRVTQLEKEKARLQVFIMEQSHSRNEELELLTSCLHDLRVQYLQLLQATN